MATYNFKKNILKFKLSIFPHRYFGLIIFFGILLTKSGHTFGQIPDASFTNKKGEIITQQFDNKGQIIKEYINGILGKEIEYFPHDSIILADLNIKPKIFEDVELKYTLEKGDSIIIRIDEKKGRKFRKIDFIQGEKGGRFSSQGKSNILWKDLVDQNSEFTLKIHNVFRLFKRSYQVNITKIPKAIPNVTHYVVDTLTKKIIIKDTLNDTLLLPVIEEMIYLPPLYDIENTSIRINKIEFPISTDSLYSFSYWIGVGEEPLQQYQELEETIPENWSQPGVSKPLGAYILGAKILLPKQPHRYVRMMIGDSLQMLSLQKKFTPSTFKNMPTSMLGKEIKFSPNKKKSQYLFLANQDSVNGYKVYVKIIATRLLLKIEEKEIIKYQIGKPRPKKEKKSKG